MNDPDAPSGANPLKAGLPMSEHGMMMTLPPGSLLPDGGLRSPENSLPIGTRLGEFEISGLVGEGGFGIVYLAVDHLLGRQVALKEYMPSSLATRGSRAQVSVRSERHLETFEAGRRSFVNEARLLAQFDHPALVKVFRFWEANGTAYMVMPYYRGRTLRQALADMGEPPSQAWLQRLLLPLVEALGTLHAAQCYHRDIAPDNILLLEDGRPVLLDFGAARRVIGDITQALTVILKPGFAPVEQYTNGPEMTQGPWTDVYALAAVIYYCATLKTPVPSVSRMMKDTLQPFGEAAGGRYDQHFCEAVDKGLAVTVEARVQDMVQFREALGLDSVAGNDRTRILPAGQIIADPLGTAPIANGRPGFKSSSTQSIAAGRTGELEPTILGPSSYAPSKEKVMTASQEPKGRNEKPWTPNADVQMERAAGRSQAASHEGRTPWVPIAAAVLLIGAGIGGYWYWHQPPAPTDPAPPAIGPATPPGDPRAAATPAPPAPPPTIPPVAQSAASPAAPSVSPGQPALATRPPAPPLAPPPGPVQVPSLVPDTAPPPPAASAAGAASGSIDGGGGPLSVGRIIDSLHQQRDGSWAVTVQVTADRVRIGKDRLRFRLRSERDGYLYLLMQGTDQSHFYQLFPNGLDQNNRLRGKTELALPRSHWEMVAGGPPGTNRFIALVTPTPRNFAAAGLNNSQPFSEFDVQTAARIFSEKGSAPFAGEPTGCKPEERACAGYGSALFEIEEF